MWGNPLRFQYKGSEWFWNRFYGFFFQPVGSKRKRERIVKEGTALYEALYSAAGQP
jgi:hypothetical protein